MIQTESYYNYFYLKKIQCEVNIYFYIRLLGIFSKCDNICLFYTLYRKKKIKLDTKIVYNDSKLCFVNFDVYHNNHMIYILSLDIASSGDHMIRILVILYTYLNCIFYM